MILNIYKPKNWTSFDVIAKLKGILKTKKVGHAGTLDPLAEGVLIVLTDSDTKKQSEFMKLRKEYIAEIALGAKSDTYDLEGELTFSNNISCISNLNLNNSLEKEILKKKIVENIKIGSFLQTVPLYSAVKVQGQRLYKKARKGNLDLDLLDLPKKEVSLYDFEILDIYEKDLEDLKELNEFKDRKILIIKCRLVCSSGFYVRSFAYDLGISLNTYGVLVSLVRTKIGEYKLEESKTLESLFLP